MEKAFFSTLHFASSFVMPPLSPGRTCVLSVEALVVVLRDTSSHVLNALNVTIHTVSIAR